MTYQDFRSRQKTFESPGGRINYIDKGEGKVILLLHGVPSSGWLYRKMIDGLVAEGYRVIAPDMLGFGSSGNPKGYEIYEEEAHAERLLALMDHLKIEHWTHVFHDAGGLWTWELFRKAPDRISNLVILNTIIYEEGFQPPIRMEKGIFTQFTMWMYRNGITTNTLLKQLFKMGLKENHMTKVDVEGYKKPLLEGKTRAMYFFFSQTCNELPDYSDMVKNIDIPTLVIWGAHDEMLVWEDQKTEVMKDLNIQPENVHVLDARHFIQEEKPKEINSLILDFLKS
ncbi:alpha/beta fold hydrolase [Leptobacterium flavescens]|uniref:Alpha/beta fold hydrolase n=1 Tax=Leptobacterium flavescens TaxID=472055 RepID=A0A6P0UTX3_9FLAO|nr:alpha/beta hydrolase [Leptobacterium flavescens]NER14283.1 alpha/beta fold hydrolase [Leptobacterium flavescens]